MSGNYDPHFALQSIRDEIDCRIEHGAESNGHLEAIRDILDRKTENRYRRGVPNAMADLMGWDVFGRNDE